MFPGGVDFGLPAPDLRSRTGSSLAVIVAPFRIRAGQRRQGVRQRSSTGPGPGRKHWLARTRPCSRRQSLQQRSRAQAFALGRLELLQDPGLVGTGGAGVELDKCLARQYMVAVAHQDAAHHTALQWLDGLGVVAHDDAARWPQRRCRPCSHTPRRRRSGEQQDQDPQAVQPRQLDGPGCVAGSGPPAEMRLRPCPAAAALDGQLLAVGPGMAQNRPVPDAARRAQGMPARVLCGLPARVHHWPAAATNAHTGPGARAPALSWGPVSTMRPPVHHDDASGTTHSTQPVGDDDHGAPLADGAMLRWRMASLS